MAVQNNKSWDKVTKRMASKARGMVKRGRGHFAILRISILIDSSGLPIGWNNPSSEYLEPSGDWPLKLLDTNLVQPIKDTD